MLNCEEERKHSRAVRVCQHLMDKEISEGRCMPCRRQTLGQIFSAFARQGHPAVQHTSALPVTCGMARGHTRTATLRGAGASGRSSICRRSLSTWDWRGTRVSEYQAEHRPY